MVCTSDRLWKCGKKAALSQESAEDFRRGVRPAMRSARHGNWTTSKTLAYPDCCVVSRAVCADFPPQCIASMQLRLVAWGSRIVSQAVLHRQLACLEASTSFSCCRGLGTARQRASARPPWQSQRALQREGAAPGCRRGMASRAALGNVAPAPPGSLTLLAPTLEATAALAELLAGARAGASALRLERPGG